MEDDKHRNNPFSLAGMVSELVKSEADAVEGQEKFLAIYEDQLKPEEVAMVKEIISDEKNHTVKWLALGRKYDSVGPSSDDLKDNADSFFDGMFGQQ